MCISKQFLHCLLISTLLLKPVLSVWMTPALYSWRWACPDNEAIKHFTSDFSFFTNTPSNDPDRVWDFTCSFAPTQPAVALTNCEWSGYVGHWEDHFTFICHNDAILTGIDTVYGTISKSRTFNFRCCVPGTYVAHGCYNTPYVNNYRDPINFSVPDGYALRGLHTQYSSTYNDRIYQFTVCKLDLLATTILG